MKIGSIAYSICKFLNAPLVAQCDSSELRFFFEQQYAALPSYIRLSFWGLYLWVYTRRRKADKTLTKWKGSSFALFREFIQYHLMLLALHAYSSPEER